MRAVTNLANGLMMFKQNIDEFLKTIFDKYKYLWSSNRDTIIQEFVNTNPLTVDIRDRFMHYDDLTSSLESAATRHVIGPIEIRMGKTMYNCGEF